MTAPPPSCPHCARPGSARLCDPPSARLPHQGPSCAVLVAEWAHPMPCVDCAGLAGPEWDAPGLMWLAALVGLTWDAPEMVEAVTW